MPRRCVFFTNPKKTWKKKHLNKHRHPAFQTSPMAPRPSKDSWKWKTNNVINEVNVQFLMKTYPMKSMKLYSISMYIYLIYPYYGWSLFMENCRHIYHTWILWVLKIFRCFKKILLKSWNQHQIAMPERAINKS